MQNFSEYIVFADESGDHGMSQIDPAYPVFVLVFCVFLKDDYINIIEPAVRRLKFDFFGHDGLILHEREIRKQMPPFEFLRGSREVRDQFYGRIETLIEQAPMRVIASVIHKDRHRQKYADPWNPYQVAMHFCMEKLCGRLVADGERGKLTHVLFESRGKGEDQTLELEFRRVATNRSQWGYRRVDFSRMEYEPIFLPKSANHAGHQISDLIARPLGLRAMRPDQKNRAADAAWEKVRDWKVFP